MYMFACTHMHTCAHTQAHTQAPAVFSRVLSRAPRWRHQPGSLLFRKPAVLSCLYSITRPLALPSLPFPPAVSGVLSLRQDPSRAGTSVVSVSCVSSRASGRRGGAVWGLQRRSSVGAPASQLRVLSLHILMEMQTGAVPAFAVC